MNELSRSLKYVRRRLEPYIQELDEYISSDDQASYYKIIKIPKRKGGYRLVRFCLNNNVRSAHKVIYEMLREYQPAVHPTAQGFVKGRSTYTNALKHTQQRYILHIDIKNFFDSIDKRQIKRALLRLGISDEVAEFISRATTIDGLMGQGLHTGPDLSNHCMYELDLMLAEFSEANALVYSRFGDDMSFSGELAPDKVSIQEIIEKNGFQVNTPKVKLQKRGSNQYVTGLTVFDESPRIPKKFKKRLRSHLYYIHKYGLEGHVKRTRNIYRENFESQEAYEHYLEGAMYGTAKYIVGHISYVNSVEPERAVSMWRIVNEHNLRDYYS